MKEKKCSSCKFWNRDGADGICRKKSPSPTVVKDGGPYTLVWPRTKDNEWCGEFEEFSV